MKFVPSLGSKSLSLHFVYHEKDHALASVPCVEGIGLSLGINDVQIELAEDGKFASVWGYCPRQSWRDSELGVPFAEAGEIRVVTEKPMIPGITVRLEPRWWPVAFCASSSWLCLGDHQGTDTTFSIEFAPGAIVTGREENIVALWIHLNRFCDNET